MFFQPGAARIIEPTSKQESLRVLDEGGLAAVSYPTLNRRLPRYAKDTFRQAVSAACAEHAAIGPASLILYDVSTRYFETDRADGFCGPGFSKERRLEPQMTIGLLTDAAGFPLTARAFEGNKAEAATMLPVLEEFLIAHRLSNITVVADAGMISEANQQAIARAGLAFILGTKIPRMSYEVTQWRRRHPGEQIPDGQIFTQSWPATAKEKARGAPDRVIHYQYRAGRARRTLRGIDEQVTKAQKAVDGRITVKRNRFIKLSGAHKSVDRELEAKARDLAEIKGYTTNLTDATAEFVVDAYHRLWHVEKAFRMSKHDLWARPIYHRKRDSIEAHVTIVLAAIDVSHWIEQTTGWSIKKFVRAARRYRTTTIRAGAKTITAAEPPPEDLAVALSEINSADHTH